jgi:hypothetical protein
MATTEKFAFVMNISALQANSYTLTPGYVLRRARHDEIAIIKQKLQGLTILLPSVMIPFLWEGRLPLVHPIETLPETEWRYHVIAFEGGDEVIVDIQTVSDLARIGFEIGFTIASQGSVFSARPMRLFQVLHKAGWFLDTFMLHQISEADIHDIMSIYSQFQATDAGLVRFKRLAIQLNHLNSLPHDSPLRFLGYFGILEALLTHAPNPNDPYDSITRQVKKKIALLNNRWKQRIDYGPFAGAEPETVWGKMYAFRSRLAHGDNPQLVKELAVLGSYVQALSLLIETVKAVLRQALLEPQLVDDLRDC